MNKRERIRLSAKLQLAKEALDEVRGEIENAYSEWSRGEPPEWMDDAVNYLASAEAEVAGAIGSLDGSES